MCFLKPGTRAPEFELLDQSGNTIRLKDFRNQKLLVYFYPKADTPGCTKQSCQLSQEKLKLKKKGVRVVGISPDTPKSQAKFDQKFNLGFPLLSDLEAQVAKKYKAYGEKRFFGRTIEGILRSAFIIDEEGKIIECWYRIKPEDTFPFAWETLA